MCAGSFLPLYRQPTTFPASKFGFPASKFGADKLVPNQNLEISMDLSGEEVARSVLDEAALTLEAGLSTITHCLAQLDEDQVWWRPRTEMNSIGNLVLHLAGNIRQWIVAGLGTAEDKRQRSAEFAERGPLPKDEILERLSAAVCEARDVLEHATAADMATNRRVQEFDRTGWGALFDSVPHFKGHTQEIVCMTRMQLGSTYKLQWEPKNPQEPQRATL